MCQKKGKPMFIPTIIMGALAIVLLFIGYHNGQGQHLSGIKSGLTMVFEILPLLVFAFIVAGMVQVLLPRELLSRWVGAESGIRGIIVGAVAGGFTPGGPFVSLPVVAALLQSGAGIGTMVAFMTGWSLWAVSRLPMEVGILGWKFTLIRFVSTFFFPPLAGLIAHTIFSSPE
ncbi:MAG: permease [Deltaproteobacteria bacterium]|nr:permease [Deltaproteobacteria bacterium]MBW2305698.1 permease [Deltaproteobacteria bacterium]